MAITDNSLDSGLMKRLESAPACRWLTVTTTIEPAAGHEHRWQVFARRDQRALGEAWVDSAGTLRCPLDATSDVRRAVARRIDQQTAQVSRFDPDDEALLELGVANDFDQAQLADYQRRVFECCSQLGIPASYGDEHRLVLMDEPAALTWIGRDVFQRPQYLADDAAKKWLAMRQAASNDGVALEPVSAFRDYRYQAALLSNKLARGDAIEQILQVNTAPGFSEHHTGRAIDVTTADDEPLEETFADTAAFAWLQRHGADFGFTMSYPKDNVHGVSYEPWHWCWQPKPGT